MLVLEKNNGLADGWQWTKIRDLVIDPKQDIVDGPFGSNLKASEYVDKGIPLIRLQNVDRNSFVNKNIRYITKEKANQLKRHNFKNQDVVVTKLGAPLGEACLVPDYFHNGIIVADIVRIRLTHEFISKKFLTYLINSDKIIQQFIKHTKGTTRPRVNLRQIRDFDVPIPPLNEQKRIVSKIEELFSYIEKQKQLIEKINLQLKQYDYSLLKHIFDSFIDKTEFLILEDLCVKVTDGEHIRPNYIQKGIPFITAKNVRDEGINFIDVDFISSTDAEKYWKRCKPEFNDVLIVSRGATVGRTCRVNTNVKFCLLGSVILLKPNKNFNSKFLIYFLKSRKTQTNLIKLSGSTAQQAIYLRDIKNLLIPNPPSNEQEKIVFFIEEKLSLIRNSKKIVENMMNLFEQMKKTILKQAFEGKLVPQDPNDEHASELLEKIKSN